MPRPKKIKVVESVELEDIATGIQHFKDKNGEWKVADGFVEIEPREAMKLLSEQKNTFGLKNVYFIDDDSCSPVILLGVRYFQTYPFFMQDDKGYFLATHCFLKK